MASGSGKRDPSSSDDDLDVDDITYGSSSTTESAASQTDGYMRLVAVAMYPVLVLLLVFAQPLSPVKSSSLLVATEFYSVGAFAYSLLAWFGAVLDARPAMNVISDDEAFDRSGESGYHRPNPGGSHSHNPSKSHSDAHRNLGSDPVDLIGYQDAPLQAGTGHKGGKTDHVMSTRAGEVLPPARNPGHGHGRNGAGTVSAALPSHLSKSQVTSSAAVAAEAAAPSVSVNSAATSRAKRHATGGVGPSLGSVDGLRRRSAVPRSVLELVQQEEGAGGRLASQAQAGAQMATMNPFIRALDVRVQSVQAAGDVYAQMLSQRSALHLSAFSLVAMVAIGRSFLSPLSTAYLHNASMGQAMAHTACFVAAIGIYWTVLAILTDTMFSGVIVSYVYCRIWVESMRDLLTVVLVAVEQRACAI